MSAGNKKCLKKASDRRRLSTKRFHLKNRRLYPLDPRFDEALTSVDDRRSKKSIVDASLTLRRRFVDAPSTIVCSDDRRRLVDDFLIIDETSTKRRHYGHYRRNCNCYRCPLILQETEQVFLSKDNAIEMYTLVLNDVRLVY